MIGQLKRTAPTVELIVVVTISSMATAVQRLFAAPTAPTNSSGDLGFRVALYM